MHYSDADSNVNAFDWLKGLTVTVANISNKGIARIELELTFPRAGGGLSPEIPVLIAPLSYSRDPSDVLPPESLKVLLPGETVDVALLDANLPFIEQDLKRLGYPEKITHARIRVNSVTFIDGSEWAGDVMLYPDPKNPKNKINPNYPTERKVPTATIESQDDAKHSPIGRWAWNVFLVEAP